MFTRTLIACLFIVLCCSGSDRISRGVLYIGFIIVTSLDFIVFTSLTIKFSAVDQDELECNKMAKNEDEFAEYWEDMDECRKVVRFFNFAIYGFWVVVILPFRILFICTLKAYMQMWRPSD